ncbi:MAG TPA: M13 family metallopeptidase, partial [Kofleriaceae bacterium]
MRSAIALILLCAACGSSKTTPTQPAPSRPPPSGDTTPPAPPPVEPVADQGPQKPIKNATLASIGLDPNALDRKADPCDDFYQFACGGWVANTQIDADKPLAMRSFVAIEDRNEEYLHDVLEKARKEPGKDPVMQKLGAFYGSCMDEAAIDKAGIKAVQPLLASINRIKDAKSLSAAVATLQAAGVNALFSFGPTEDSGDATRVIAGIDQGGIGVPDRDYYLVDNDQNKAVRTAYADYLTTLLVEAGHKADKAKQEAADIMALETEIAKVSKDKVARRDPKGTYNKIDREGVAKAMPHFEWDGFWKTLGLAKNKDVTVTSPEFLTGVDPLLTKTKPETWRNYLTAHTLNQTASFLTKKIEDARFKYSQALTGQPEQRARWKRCVGQTDAGLGDLLAQVFVRDRFAGASKTAAEEQVQAITKAMQANLEVLPWMDATTKTKAREKLAAMAYYIGYPNKWREYKFKVDPKAWGANGIAASKAETARQLAKIGKPVDRDDWGMTAPTVNAYYSPNQNKMVFPAGVLQPPFYSVDASVAVNLGAMGMVVGHELTHGFDDQGAQFDAQGNMKNWWQPETEKQFKQRTQCVIDQYKKYGLNGENTVGENIADIGGIKLSMAAYRSLRSSAPDTTVADGFTEDQQFFLSFGQAWCAKLRPEYEKMLITVDPHSP